MIFDSSSLYWFVTSGTIVVSIGICVTAILVGISIVENREPFRYLRPKRLRSLQTELKVAELQNRIDFEHLKHDKLMDLREGKVKEELALETVLKGRSLVDAKERERRY